MEYKVGDVIKYHTRTYGYFYGESNEKRMVVSIRTGVIKQVIKHNNRVSYYSTEMIQATYPRVIKLKGVIDSVYPDEIETQVLIYTKIPPAYEIEGEPLDNKGTS